jgi:uncharacterized protein involved in exopolysaccharide biosynthesis
MSLSRSVDPAPEGGAQAFLLARRALRYWKGAVLVGLVGLGATFGLMKLVKETYRSQTVLQYRTVGRHAYADVESSRRLGSRLDDMLRSRERLARIREELSLFPELGRTDRAVEEILKNIGFRAREGSTFVISYDGKDPVTVQQTARRLAETLIEDNRRQRSEEGDAVRRFLETQRADIQAEVARKETALQDFLRKHPQLAALDPLGGFVDDAQIAEWETQLNDVKARLSVARPAGAAPVAGAGPSPELLGSLQQAEQEAAQARKDLSDKRLFLTEAHPDVAAAAERLRQAEARRASARTAVEALQGKAGVGPVVALGIDDPLYRAQSELQSRISQARRARAAAGRTAAERAKLLPLEVQRQSLQRDLDEARLRLGQIEEKRFQVSVAANIEASGETGALAVLDPANLPVQPTTSTRKKVALLGFALSAFLALLVAALRALTDDRIFDRVDIMSMTSRPVLVVVPRRQLGEHRG